MFIVILVEVVGVVDGGAVWMAAMGMMLLLTLTLPMDCRIVQHTAEQRRLDE